MLSLFLLSIPPQLAPSLGSWTIPVTGVATFCFLGVDSIGEKLADPFGVHGQSDIASRSSTRFGEGRPD